MTNDVFRLLRAFAVDESGTTAIEYGLIAAGIAGAVIGTVNAMGGNMRAVFYGKIATALTGG